MSMHAQSVGHVAPLCMGMRAQSVGHVSWLHGSSLSSLW